MGETKEKSSFSGKLGYVMAVAGSAVGLGNIWRFPYLAAKYGGGIFLFTYVILAVTFGFALLISESALGRKTGCSPIQAFQKLAGNKLRLGGWLNAVIPMLILPYYSVVGGWVCKYLFEYGLGHGTALASDTYFLSFMTSSWTPIIWLIVFACIVFVVVMFGVEKGIERVSKILMPTLVVMAIFIAVYSLSVPGSLEGLKYYIIPDFSRFSIMTVVSAMGQMFYSLSIGMGILYTYGSYMRKDINMESSVGQIEIMDTLIAFLAGMMIIPAVFAFSGGNPDTLNAGPSLMFITMPKVFGSIPFGQVVAFVFFLLILFAALTSAISLMESCVATIEEQFHWSRKKACCAIFGFIIVIGIPCSLGFGVLDFIQPIGMSLFDFFDFMTNSIMMPISAMFTCLLIVKVIGIDVVIKEVERNGRFKRKKIYVFCMKYLVIIGLIIIFISSILNAMGIITM